MISKCSLLIQMNISKCKIIPFLKDRIILLILGRCHTDKLASLIVAFNLIVKHEIIDLSITVEGLHKHNSLISVWTRSVPYCLVCHPCLPEIICIAGWFLPSHHLWSVDRNSVTRTSPFKGIYRSLETPS